MQVSKKEQYLDGLPRFNLIINYNAKQHEFSIPLPPFMAGPLSVKEVTGSTQDEVEKRFKEAIELIKQVDRKISKVIIYNVCVQDNERFIEMKFRAAVANETKSTVGDLETKDYEVLPSSLLNDFRSYSYGGCRSIPWNEEAEKWFAGIQKALLDVKAQLLSNGEFPGPYYGDGKEFVFGAGKQAGGPK